MGVVKEVKVVDGKFSVGEGIGRVIWEDRIRELPELMEQLKSWINELTKEKASLQRRIDVYQAELRAIEITLKCCFDENKTMAKKCDDCLCRICAWWLKG